MLPTTARIVAALDDQSQGARSLSVRTGKQRRRREVTRRKTTSRKKKRRPTVAKPTEKPRSPIEKLRAHLAGQQEEFREQWKEVKEKYPLVALAFGMQQATIAELIHPARLEIASLSLLKALTQGRRLTWLDRVRRCKERYRECIDELMEAYAPRYPPSSELLGCYLEYHSCLDAAGPFEWSP